MEIKGQFQKCTAKTLPGRMYPRELFERAMKQYDEALTNILVELIMESKPVRVLELPRKQIVP